MQSIPTEGIYPMQILKHPPLLQQKVCILTRLLQASLSKSDLKKETGDAWFYWCSFETENIYTDREEISFHHLYVSDKNKLHNYEDKTQSYIRSA